MSLIGSTFQKFFNPIFQQTRGLRFMYHKEKVEHGPIIKRYGYNDDKIPRGQLPRIATGKALPIPQFKPKDSWCNKRALFGQNDYIDILGSGNLHPTRVLYNVPSWLRGVKGIEYQVLLRKRKILSHTPFPAVRPTKFNEIRKRINYLYKYLNTKTKSQT